MTSFREPARDIPVVEDTDVLIAGAGPAGAMATPGKTNWRWQYVFAADDFSEDPRSGRIRRHHVDEQYPCC